MSVLRAAPEALAKGRHAILVHLFAAYVSRPHRRQFEATWETADRVLGYLSEENGAVLFETVQVVRPRTILEIGSFLGRSTVLLALAQRSAGIADARLVTVDPHRGQHTPRDDPDAEIDPVTLGVFRQSLARAGVEALVEPWVMTSGEAVHRWKEPIDLLYVDGWHSFDAVMDDARSFLPYLSPSGVVIFDDYSHPLWPGVGKAVHALVEEGAFHLWGPVFTQAMGRDRSSGARRSPADAEAVPSQRPMAPPEAPPSTFRSTSGRWPVPTVIAGSSSRSRAHAGRLRWRSRLPRVAGAGGLVTQRRALATTSSRWSNRSWSRRSRTRPAA